MSDKRKNFWSELISEICEVLEVKIAKCCETKQHIWDDNFPKYCLHIGLWCKRVQESPFFLLYGRDPCISLSMGLLLTRSVYSIDTDDYHTQILVSFAEAWHLAQNNIEHAQCKQKDS